MITASLTLVVSCSTAQPLKCLADKKMMLEPGARTPQAVLFQHLLMDIYEYRREAKIIRAQPFI